jgi:hypothetical protein
MCRSFEPVPVSTELRWPVWKDFIVGRYGHMDSGNDKERKRNSRGVIELSPEDTLLLSRAMFLQDLYVKVS